MERRPIPGFLRYEATADGRVFRVRAALRGAPLGEVIGRPDKDGYLRIHLWGEKGKRLVGVHHVVCLAFHGPRPTLHHEAAHGDGLRQNNRPENLRWATRQENAKDAIAHGTQPRGERHGRSKLDAGSVLAIREAAAAGASIAAIAQQHSVSRKNIRSIIQRHSWAHIE